MMNYDFFSPCKYFLDCGYVIRYEKCNTRNVLPFFLETGGNSKKEDASTYYGN